MRARGNERREAIWFRDAEAAEAIDAVLFVGLADWYPPVYDCGACGYATCAEFLHATKRLRNESEELEFVGPQCNLRDIDLGIAVGSAAKTAAIHSIDARCQTRIAVAARRLSLIKADIAVALCSHSRSPTRRSASTGVCPTLTSTHSTSPAPERSRQAFPARPVKTAPEIASKRVAPPGAPAVPRSEPGAPGSGS
jgi:uncharacterized ferredoxin-like protein